MNTPPTAVNETRQTFRVREVLPLMRPAFFACAAAFVLVLLISEPDSRWISLIVGAVLLFSLALCYWLLTRTRLEISPQGIVYHAVGYRVHSTWSNLEGYAKRVQGALNLECLILREPGMELSGWMRIGYQALPPMNFISLLSGRGFHPNQLDRYEGVIPVETFDKNWRSGEIGRLVKRYAPGAYENALQ